MKLIYITSKKFPSTKADPFYTRKMAEAFTNLLKHNFLFLVRDGVPDQLKYTNAVSVKFPRRFRMIFYFIWTPFLVKIHKWNNRETVFLSYDPYLLVILIFWRKVFRFKYFISSDWHQLFDDWRDRYVALNSDYVITTSKRLKGFLSSICGVVPEKILVAYGGVDKASFIEKSKIKKADLRKGLGLPVDVFLVGYVGGFRSVGMEKGLDIMIKSLPYLREDIRMVFVGGSKQYIDEYIKFAEELKVDDKCIFVEKQSFDKVVEYEIAMDTLVIPYPDKHHFRDYGFPMKVWEYMSSGCPIVYSDLEIIREILGGRGVSFIPDNAFDLANAILSVYKDIDVASETARKNIDDVEAYTWEARARNIINFINK